MTVDLLLRKRTRFVLWRPAFTEPVPALYIGSLPPRAGAGLRGFREIPLRPHPEFPELWELSADECGLEDGVYLYWFKVRDSQPYDARPRVLYCTDPMAFAVDRRFAAPAPAETGGERSGHAASVILLRQGRLLPCDPGGEPPPWAHDPPVASLSPNSRLVIYELPTRWVRAQEDANGAVGVGTFRDVLALVDPEASPPGFSGIPALGSGRALLRELGVNALELLPAADSDDDLNWGYGTAHFFAADFHLGGGTAEAAPAAASDLRRLVETCHRRGLRFFADMVMAFARNCPYRNAGFPDFFVRWKPPGDPDRDPEHGDRDGFGGDLFKFNYRVDGYQPIQGGAGSVVPAREYMKAQMAHWIDYYRVDGLRLDSVNNTGSYDFLQEFKDLSRELWRTQERGRGTPAQDLEERFLVVGEELSVPLALLAQRRLDGLWNERFKQILRQLILGRPAPGLDLEESVRRLVDCRLLGFDDGAQVVNYVTSHDVGGMGNERLHDYLVANGVAETEGRIKLAFVCLMTAVGIPMILAGEEFADQHDLDIRHEHGSAKQVDPVNYGRLEHDWRRRVFDLVARLARFRSGSAALSRNDTAFLHADCTDGKQVFAWQRGDGEDVVVVVANFSEWGSPDPSSPQSEYVVPGFPSAPPGRSWREVTQDRAVPDEWIGREPIYPWEAKVYALGPPAP